MTGTGSGSREAGKLPRCPKGTRRNRKTGKCEKHAKPRLVIVDRLTSVRPEQEAMPQEAMPQEAMPQAVQDEVYDADESSQFSYLYPTLDDPLFNKKIAERREFYDTRYVGRPGDVETEGDRLCNAEFELSPHQMFVRNFMSFQTPYNSLLLYHGLGSGKTCSAISVAEEMRDYMKQVGIAQRILVVASPNVQENFKLQLFDDRKLVEVDGLWNIRACTGNKFLKEINPMSMKGLSRERVVSQVRRIISGAYLFMGYIEFANYVEKKAAVPADIPTAKRERVRAGRLRKHFGNRLLIIDEVHNIRMTDDNKDKRVAIELEKLVDNVRDMRLLFLSATPMYNSYKESVWLINLMNKNDGRTTVQVKDVFAPDGTFRTDEDGVEVGRELLVRKATGYVSFMRGDNPYTFPFRIWPDLFAPQKTFAYNERPTRQLNGTPVLQDIDFVSLYLDETGSVQQTVYDAIIAGLKSGDLSHGLPSFENMESFGYTLLQRPLEALNMVYPAFSEKVDLRDMVGKGGLDRVMSYRETVTPPQRGDFEYRPGVPRVFAPSEIGKYSGKIASICAGIVNSTGVALVYSQYIDGGVVPVALALEELGFTRAGGGRTLMKSRPEAGGYRDVPPPSEWTRGDEEWRELNDALVELVEAGRITAATTPSEALALLGGLGVAGGHADLEPMLKIALFNATNNSRYVVITGDKALSPDNVADLKAVTDPDNSDGSRVRVVIISQAGSEGLDFNFIRQVHVLEPWYNMNRIEQIIGRAVRTCSHKKLPFRDRNVQIYLHGSLLSDREDEAADIYVYRLAELKAVQIGHVSRALKEASVDCLLSADRLGFTVEDMKQTVQQDLANGDRIQYQVGDKPYSAACDYMDTCSYSCTPVSTIDEKDVRMDTYNRSFITMNTDRIAQRIRDLMKEKYFYRKVELVRALTAVRHYPMVQIDAALTQLVDDRNEYISDRYGRLGHLVNIGDLYLFQPLELNNSHISVYDRSVPVEWKRSGLAINLPDPPSLAVGRPDAEEARNATSSSAEEIMAGIRSRYEVATTPQAIKRGDDDWYKFCDAAIGELVELGESRGSLERLVIEHIVDELPFSDTLSLLQAVDRGDTGLGPLHHDVLSYLTADAMTANGLTGILLDNMGSQSLIVKREGGTWESAEPEDYVDLENELASFVARFVPVERKLNTLIGFMTEFKNEFMVFKTRDFSKKRTMGARCDQATKTAGVKVMNQILGRDRYATSTPISKRQLCVMQELVLRGKTRDGVGGKVWFLNPIQATITNIEKASF